MLHPLPVLVQICLLKETLKKKKKLFLNQYFLDYVTI